MPLSEHEQRLLEEMERSLYHNDADFVATVGGRRVKPGYRAIVLGVLLAVVGVGVLVAGVFVQLPIIGILGFIIMFAGVLIAIAPPKKLAAAPDDVTRPQAPNSGAGHTGFMDKLNDRWDKRQDGQG
jgi:Protein of unknown function (DUF3040)